MSLNVSALTQAQSYQLSQDQPHMLVPSGHVSHMRSLVAVGAIVSICPAPHTVTAWHVTCDQHELASVKYIMPTQLVTN